MLQICTWRLRFEIPGKITAHVCAAEKNCPNLHHWQKLQTHTSTIGLYWAATEKYPNHVNYMVTQYLYSLYCIKSWVHISLVPHGCMLFVYKALYPFVTWGPDECYLCRPPVLLVRTVTVSHKQYDTVIQSVGIEQTVWILARIWLIVSEQPTSLLYTLQYELKGKTWPSYYDLMKSIVLLHVRNMIRCSTIWIPDIV